MLRALLVLCLVSTAAPAVTQEYQSKDLSDAARDWRRELIDSVPAIKKQPAIIGGINVMGGKVRNEAVAHAHGLAYVPLEW